MDIQCLQDHMRGKKVLTDNGTYEVGLDGIIRDVKDADAAEMLKMPSSYRKPVSRIAVPVPAPTAKAEEPKAEEPKDGAPKGAEESAEWPDPDESMELAYLQKMADAYEVKYETKTTKKALVKMIRKAMFE